jgi:hypothetical protein
MNTQLLPALVNQYKPILPDKKILQTKRNELFKMWNDKIGE